MKKGPVIPANWWHRLDDGRVQCDLCPRDCKLHEGQRGFCFVRAREGDGLVLTTYGRSSGFTTAGPPNALASVARASCSSVSPRLMAPP